LIISNV